MSVALAKLSDIKHGILVVASREKLLLITRFQGIGVLRTGDEEDPPNDIAAGILRYEQKSRVESDPK